jgi:hypothetical protein
MYDKAQVTRMLPRNAKDLRQFGELLLMRNEHILAPRILEQNRSFYKMNIGPLPDDVPNYNGAGVTREWD